MRSASRTETPGGPREGQQQPCTLGVQQDGAHMVSQQDGPHEQPQSHPHPPPPPPEHPHPPPDPYPWVQPPALPRAAAPLPNAAFRKSSPSLTVSARRPSMPAPAWAMAAGFAGIG
jgi:hypothetical protein